MRENAVSGSGRPAVLSSMAGAVCQAVSPPSSWLISAGIRWFIDTQHGLVGYQDMVAMLQGISTTAVTPMVRVSWNDSASIMKALDAGAYV